ncbi:MAG: hypothetical protein ACQKBY_08315 [Verrucomicrobiales bacterium]
MSEKGFLVSVGLGLFLLLGGVGSCMYGYPKYRVYKQALRGEAALREAEWEKKILIEQAVAEEQAAMKQAEARITLAQAENEAMKIKAEGEAERELMRAKATAEANQILGESLKENEAYLRYLWITNMDGEGERIYIPTEAGMPILEVGK